MYSPEEDSSMLARQVQKHAKGNVLDVGTGSGIQALAAARNNEVKSILGIDVDEESIAYCKKNIKDRKITFLISNLFSKIKEKEKFDTIIFNPPYLPKEKKVKIKNKALYGGKLGSELITKFFNQVKKHLAKQGIILMVFSSKTNKERVDKIIAKVKLKIELLDRQHIFFEDLYVYLIKKE